MLLRLLNFSKGAQLGIVCTAITAGILVAGLWPFNFIPANKVEWIRNGNGIRFHDRGIAYNQKTLSLWKSAAESAPATFELLIRPHQESVKVSASILTFYNGTRERFIFARSKSNFHIRVPFTSTDNRIHDLYLGIETALPSEISRFLTVTSGAHGTSIYLNGKLVKHDPHYTLISAEPEASGRFVLGNSPEGKHPWKGDLLGMAVYGRVLTRTEIIEHYNAWQFGHRRPLEKEKPLALYLFDEHAGEQIRDHSGGENHLLTPRIFRPLRRTMLHALEKDRWLKGANLLDMTVNILGFLPLGLYFCAWMVQSNNISRIMAVGITLLAGCGLSLAMELSQVYLPSRDSSLTDIFTNTLGTALGVLLFNRSRFIIQKAGF